jgi:hypothetical protein
MKKLGNRKRNKTVISRSELVIDLCLKSKKRNQKKEFLGP